MSPLYLRKCKLCGMEKDFLIKLKDFDKPINCPNCGSTFENKICASPIQYKADGFHSCEYTRHGRKDQTPKSYYEQKKKLKEAGAYEKLNPDPYEGVK